MCPGFRFSLDPDPVSGQRNVDLVIREITHQAVDETWLGGTASPTFEASFTCFRSAVTWRDDLSIPRPAMTGIFSGIVLGEAGEEIHADRLGRIKVRPLFDHRKESTAAKSIFIRVLHAWAGDHWGWQHLPRVGTEVGISFMNGDPDNPVVVGCFYHEDNPPVFPIPSEQTKQGFRSRSTMRGGTRDYNELSFDDRKDQEVVLLHAQRDHKVEVERNQDIDVGRDRTVTTQRHDSLTSVIGDVTLTAATGAITLSAQTTLTLVVGPTTIVLTPAGIRVAAPTIAVQAGEVNVSAGAITVQAASVAFATPLFEAPPPIPPI
jgi:type VI secretion system secreted protein VgrG